MAYGSRRNTNTGDYVDVSCFYSQVGPSGIYLFIQIIEYMFSAVIVQTLLVHAILVQSTGIYNMINKETGSSGSAYAFCIHLVVFKA